VTQDRRHDDVLLGQAYRTLRGAVTGEYGAVLKKHESHLKRSRIDLVLCDEKPASRRVP
jgi:hypothetical protein